MEQINVYCPVKNIKYRKESWCNRYVKTMDKNLSVITLCALVFSLLYKLVFLRWEAPCESVYHLGDWTFILSMSVLAASVFHFFTVHYTLIRDRELYADIVNASICSLITKSNTFIGDPLKIAGFEYVGDVPAEEDWEKCNTIDIEKNLLDWTGNCLVIASNTKMEYEILSNYKDEYKDIFILVTKLYGTCLVRSIDALNDVWEKKKAIDFVTLIGLLKEYLQALKPFYKYYNDFISEALNSSRIEV